MPLLVTDASPPAQKAQSQSRQSANAAQAQRASASQQASARQNNVDADGGGAQGGYLGWAGGLFSEQRLRDAQAYVFDPDHGLLRDERREAR